MKTEFLLKTVRGTSYETHNILGNSDRGNPEEHPYYDTFRARQGGYEIWLKSCTVAYLSAKSGPSISIRIIHAGRQYSEQYFIGVHCTFTISDLDEAMLRAKTAIEQFINSLDKMSDMESYISLNETISSSYVDLNNHFFRSRLPFELPWEPIRK